MKQKGIEEWNEKETDTALIGSMLSAGAVAFVVYLCLIFTGCATTRIVQGPDGKTYTTRESTTVLGMGTDYGDQSGVK